MKPVARSSWWWAPWFISAALVLGTALVYLQVLVAGFSNFDDPYYVTENMHVRQGLNLHGIGWAFTSTAVANWHPLTWISLELDYELFGLNPAGFHLTNLVLHLANTLLVFWTLRVYTRSLWGSACVAALFGIHPLHVESVAWVTERKDVLSTLFWLLAMLAYYRYAARPSLMRYLIVAMLLALGLMAKQMLVTLPCVFLLLDYWPLGRLRLSAPSVAGGDQAAPVEQLSWQKLLLEKTPLLALCAACSILTLFAQSTGGAVASAVSTPLRYRLMNVADAYIAYLAKTIWPLNLAVFYPHTLHRQSWLVAIGNGAILVAISWWTYRRRRAAPYLLVGWCWYLGTLVPVIGLVQVGAQALADRYTYVPLIGIFWMTVWGMHALVAQRRLSPKLAGMLALMAIASFGACTWVQTGYWVDDVRLWQHALKVSGPSAQVYDNLSGALLREGRLNDALPYLQDLVRYAPDNSNGHLNLGLTLWQTGDHARGVEEIERALELKPSNAEARYNYGYLLSLEGRIDEAIAQLRQSVAMDPFYWRAHLQLSKILKETGDEQESLRHYREAQRLNPEVRPSER